MKSIFKQIDDMFVKRGLRTGICLKMLLLHLLGLSGLILVCQFEFELRMRYFIAFMLIHSITALGITGGAHRLWAHKAYEASLPIRIFLMLMNSNCFQGSIYRWSRDHRLHHKFSDTELDPHDSTRGFWFSHIGWLLTHKNEKLIQEGKKIDMSDLKKDPVVMFQHNYYYPLSIFMAFYLFPLIGYMVLGGGIITSILFLGFTKNVFFLHGTWCVNSVCHKWGSKPYNKNIEPRDNIFVSLLTQGEGWHNWHHEYQNDWKGSKNEWWMINQTYTFIKISTMLGLASTPSK